MKNLFKIVVTIILILIVVFVLFVVIVRSLFIVMPMPTNSMKPLLTTNDVVVAKKRFDISSLSNGDLVVVNLSIPDGTKILTVRIIDQRTNTPAGQFYLSAASTNGIDSKFLGTLPATDIRGKVIHIFKGAY
ncbi:MAG TPA: S26 family signal peptidase [Methylomirabilota bacterium]|nr:S26 family signal peptidase [Methylomirabilota bacterium]